MTAPALGYPGAAAAAAPRARSGPAVVTSGYWRHAVVVAALALAAVDVRVHEGVPLLFKFRLVLLTSYVGLAAVLYHTRRQAVRDALRSPLVRLAFAYFGWALVSIPFALWPGGARTAVQAAVPTVLTMLLVVLCPPTRRALDRLHVSLFWAAVVSAVMARMAGRLSEGTRLAGVGSFDPNDLASVLAACVPLGVALVMRGRPLARVAALAGTGVLVGVITMTGSRGGFLALAASTLVLVAGQPARRLAPLLVAGAIASAVTWQFAGPTFRERISGLVGGEEDYNYTAYSGRKAIWRRARGYALHNPVFGVGMSNFSVAEGMQCQSQGITCTWIQPHNAYYQAFAELGFPGGILFVSMIAVGGRTAARVWRPARARTRRAMHRPEWLASLAGFAAGALFLSQAYFYLLFGLLGLVTLAERVRRAEEDGEALPANDDAAPARAPRAGMRGGLRGGVAGAFLPGAAAGARLSAWAGPTRRGGLA